MIYTKPSNLALIKYMGKKPKNQPINPSLSYTLNHLVTGVKIEESTKDEWKPLEGEKWHSLALDKNEQMRYLSFFKKLKDIFSITSFHTVYSANNFPKSAGIASSASSFSALTDATYNLSNNTSLTKEELAQISREGSGSSCRSFFEPWCLWTEQEVKGISLKYNNLSHQVIIIEQKEKSISSSEAHQRVITSPLFKEREKRTSQRLKDFLGSIDQWESLYSIVYEEFEDMHQLFETASPCFSYRTEEVRKVLEYLKYLWETEKDGPLVTMDAGPSIHLLYRPDQKTWEKEIVKKFPNVSIY